MLKGNAGKVKSKTEVCLFVKYLRGIKGGLFYSPKDQKVIVSTNTQFLKEDYMMNHKSRSRVVIKQLRKDKLTHTFSIPIVQEDTSEGDDISLPSHSWRIVNASADYEPESDSEPAQYVAIDTQSQRVSHQSGRVIR